MKVIKDIFITQYDRKVYRVPAIHVARSRADHYAVKVDGLPPDSIGYWKEVEYALSDEYELTDWMQNNMNWCDLEPFAVLVVTPKQEVPDYNENWSSAQFRFK